MTRSPCRSATSPIITLITDFGGRDHYVAAMKGAVLSEWRRYHQAAGQAPGQQLGQPNGRALPGLTLPDPVLIDITHEVEPHRVDQAAYLLSASCWGFPAHTVHLAVVDPGVGGSRRTIAVQSGTQLFVGPDNGLLSFAWQSHRTRDAGNAPITAVDTNKLLKTLGKISSTFHGRDLMAVAAARLAAGAQLEALGEAVAVDRLVSLPAVKVKKSAGQLTGRAIHVDRFGNIITNIEAAALAALDVWKVRLGDRQLGSIRRTYSDVAAGELLVVVGSGGYIEIAVNQGSAAELVGSEQLSESVVLTCSN